MLIEKKRQVLAMSNSCVRAKHNQQMLTDRQFEKKSKRIIYVKIEPIVDPLLPHEQAGFRHRRSTLDQTTRILSQENEDRFLSKKKTGVMFVDFTAADDTV